MAQLTLHYIRDMNRRELLPPRGHREGLGAIPVLPKPPERGLCPSPAPQRAGPSLCAPAARRLPGGKARPGRAAGESLMRNELEQNL